MIIPEEDIQSAIVRAAKLIRKSRKAVSLTGAGYSTASGIPDFRSPTSGLWEHHDPMEVASLHTFRFRPQVFFDWFRPLAAHITSAAPNPAHYALAEMERAGFFNAVVTQNIDGLHQRAGSVCVHEVHGSITRLICPACYRPYASDEFMDAYLQSGRIPCCPVCNHMLKPDVVLFEEQLPLKVWQQAEAAVAASDLILVAGSSLAVYPVANLPFRALAEGAAMIIVNKTPTHLDPYAEVLLSGDVAEIMPRIRDEVFRE